MANITKIEATFDDNTTEVLFPVAASVPMATVTEVDVKMSDGSTEVEKPVDAEEATETA